MPFRKFPSIENSYRDKEICYWLDKFPELRDETYIITEKLDGSCISFVYEPDGTFHVAKRSGFVGSDENFYDIQRVVYNEYKDIMYVFKNFAQSTKSTLNVYGELFGKGIQKRINYGPEKYIRFFDVTVDDVMFSQREIEDFFSSLNIEDMLVPNFGTVKGLQAALDFNVEGVPTLINPDGGSFIEGVVIKPYEKMYMIPYGEDTPTTKLGNPFYLKKKSEKFNEVKPKREKKEVDEGIEVLRNSFKDYITENRVLSVFSKYGEIEHPKQIGDYIRLVLNDAKEEFEKDYSDDLYELDKNELKQVYNVSKNVLAILNKYL